MTLTRAVVQLCRVHADPATDPRARDNGTPAAEGRGSLGTVCALVLMLVAGFIGGSDRAFGLAEIDAAHCAVVIQING